MTEQRRRRSIGALGMSPTQAPASLSKGLLASFCLMAVSGAEWQQGAEEHGEELVLLGHRQVSHKLLRMNLPL